MGLDKSHKIQEEFTDSFKQLNFKGIKKLLEHNPRWFYLDLIEENFKTLKLNGISSLEVYKGNCEGCRKGCKGFTFIDENSGNYIDLILENNESEISFINECFRLKNSNKNINKKQFWLMDPLVSCHHYRE